MIKFIISFLLLLVPFSAFAETVTLSTDNVIVMDSEYSSESVAKIALKAQELDSKLPFGKAIYLVILSPGGNIDAGLELIDNLNGIKRTIHTVTLFSASMAFQNVQGLPGKRYITRSGTLMAHKARGGFQGEFPGQIDSRFNYWLRRLTRLDEIVVSRSKGKLTLESFQKLYENEYWCEGQDCVDNGLADEVVTITCDTSLSGTKTVEEAFSFLGIPIKVKITRAACPTITAALDSKVIVDGAETKDPEEIENLVKKFKLTASQINQLKSLVEQKIEALTPSTHESVR